MSRSLYRFSISFRRSGDLTGIFTAEPEQLEAAYGRHIYLGEVLGKHSEVYFDLDSSMITLIESEARFVDWFDTVVGGSGINPLHHLPEDEEEEEEEEEEEDE